MQAAAEAANVPGGPRLLAVTVLTSMDAAELAGVGVAALLASRCCGWLGWLRRLGLMGWCARPRRWGLCGADLGAETMLVVPGIRPAGSDVGDQRRVATPRRRLRGGLRCWWWGGRLRRRPIRGLQRGRFLRRSSGQRPRTKADGTRDARCGSFEICYETRARTQLIVGAASGGPTTRAEHLKAEHRIQRSALLWRADFESA